MPLGDFGDARLKISKTEPLRVSDLKKSFPTLLDDFLLELIRFESEIQIEDINRLSNDPNPKDIGCR